MLSFDDRGVLNSALLLQQAAAATEFTLPFLAGDRKADDNVVDASARFTVRGGGWTPDRALDAALREAALGKRKCPSLQGSTANRRT